jgi:1,4-alpha-glucan branching enzyme
VKRDSALQALAEARHADPFSVLGPHPDPRGLVIRALVPTAERIRVTRNGSGSVEMERRHPAGIFEAVLPGTAEIPDYRLEVLYHGGSTSEIDDPYRYGRILSDYDLYLFGEGKHTRIYEKLGAHPTTIGGSAGVHFAVWAPNAKRVSVVGDFNAWDGRRHPMRSLGGSGVWEIFIPGLYVGEKYKFEILSRYGEVVLKSDPFGFTNQWRCTRCTLAPGAGSRKKAVDT